MNTSHLEPDVPLPGLPSSTARPPRTHTSPRIATGADEAHSALFRDSSALVPAGRASYFFSMRSRPLCVMAIPAPGPSPPPAISTFLEKSSCSASPSTWPLRGPDAVPRNTTGSTRHPARTVVIARNTCRTRAGSPGTGRESARRRIRITSSTVRSMSRDIWRIASSISPTVQRRPSPPGSPPVMPCSAP